MEGNKDNNQNKYSLKYGLLAISICGTFLMLINLEQITSTHGLRGPLDRLNKPTDTIETNTENYISPEAVQNSTSLSSCEYLNNTATHCAEYYKSDFGQAIEYLNEERLAQYLANYHIINNSLNVNANYSFDSYKYPTTPLGFIADPSHGENAVNITNILLDFPDVDVNIRNRIDSTLLHVALQEYYPMDIFNKLLGKKGIDLNIKDQNGLTATCLSAHRQNSRKLVSLMKAGASPNEVCEEATGEKLIHIAMLLSNWIFLSVIKSPHIDLNAVDKRGLTAICFMDEEVHVEQLNLNRLALIQAGANPNVICDTNTNDHPIHMAVTDWDSDIFNAIIEAKNVDLNAVNKDGLTAIDKAIEAGFFKKASAMLKAGANTDSSLCSAVNSGDIKTSTELVELGANQNIICNQESMEWLIHIAVKGDLDLLLWLINTKGINLNVTNEKGKAPICNAFENGHYKKMEALISAGANIDIMCDNSTGEMLIHKVAGIIGNPALFSLVADKENIHFPDRSGRTAYCIISNKKMAPKLEILKEKGIMPRAQCDGEVPLARSSTKDMQPQKPEPQIAPLISQQRTVLKFSKITTQQQPTEKWQEKYLLRTSISR